MKRIALFCALLAVLLALPLHATETGVGRSITGMQATSYSGLIPPAPGLTWQYGYAYYDGSISASKQVPIAGGGSALGLKAEFQLATITGLYIWKTAPSSWNFASMMTMPFAYVTPTSMRDSAVSAQAAHPTCWGRTTCSSRP